MALSDDKPPNFPEFRNVFGQIFKKREQIHLLRTIVEIPLRSTVYAFEMYGEELDFPSENLLDSFNIDDFLVQTQSSNNNDDSLSDIQSRAQACTHTHACNPPGPDKTHTHTCIHVHTQIMPDEKARPMIENKPKTRPKGNREAVRKYRERKKAKAKSLENEVVKLRALNEEMMKRLQNRAMLEAEVSRLKCLLVDIRGKIGSEIGSFPYKKSTISTNNENNNDNNLVATYVSSCNGEHEAAGFNCPGCEFGGSNSSGSSKRK
ncbi:Basic-leucine zipper (bZIP) transcription factor family protein [Striga hermonthica]|uniref:Basic-leucine zipper (BZIP) transcription factor family protein n=1 Tax=Striga hermonthica TaxID=68872 RepID=A0A9N7RI17_STRHE|nr:Basic-leucine zipper (bZIP) transcription factor family protein [Striga hermonthica]